MICEFCNRPHDGSYGSGRFCSSKCARSFSTASISEKSRLSQIDGLKKGRENRIKNLSNNKISKNTTCIHSQQPKNKLEKSPISSTTRKGIYGELFTATKFAEHGIPVYIPFGNVEDSDLIVDINGNLKKVQVKTSSVLSDDCETTLFTITKQKAYINKKDVYYISKKYSNDDIDYMALCDVINKRVYLMTPDEYGNRYCINIRNNSKNKTLKSNMHDGNEYDIDIVLENMMNDKNIIDIDYKEL